MKRAILFLLLLLPAFSYCRAIPQHRSGWGAKLDVREKAVQQFLKHTKGSSSEELPEKGSGVYHNDFVGFDDSEPGDSNEEGNETELTLQAKKTSGCVHPNTRHIFEIGSFDFDEVSCMMCECPSGKLKCYKTC